MTGGMRRRYWAQPDEVEAVVAVVGVVAEDENWRHAQCCWGGEGDGCLSSRWCGDVSCLMDDAKVLFWGFVSRHQVISNLLAICDAWRIVDEYMEIVMQRAETIRLKKRPLASHCRISNFRISQTRVFL